MAKRIAIIGDATNTGGKVITASGSSFCGTSGIALLGDLASCPKCKKGVGTIIEATHNFVIDGIPAAYDGCIVACGCTPVGSHRIIATKSYLFVDAGGSYSSNITSRFSATSLEPTTQTTNYNALSGNQTYSSQNTIMAAQQQNNHSDDKTLIRADAQRLLQCADELCEKHLYHDDIKQAFRQDIQYFANNIVYQVDNGSLTYEQGAEQIKDEEDNLVKQSVDWVTNGLSILGGIGMVSAGFGLCSTGLGCLIGAPLMLHGGNGLYEGIMGTSNGLANLVDGGNRPLSVDGPLREIYKDSAKALGFDTSVGSLVYDLVDLGISVKGKLKLVPKLNDLGNPTRKLWYFGVKDLERAYLQMKKFLLLIEIGSDIISLIKISNKIIDQNNAFVLSEDKKNVSMVVNEPEKIINVKDIVENCSLFITITGGDDDTPTYFRCERTDGSKYNKDLYGNIINEVNF